MDPRPDGEAPSDLDAALTARTGRGLAEWLALLADARDGRAAARHLRRVHGLNLHWSKRIAAAWEAERGLPPRPRALEIGVSRVFAMAPEALFDHWADPAARAAWLGLDLEIRRADPPRRLQGLRHGLKVEIGFFPKSREGVLIGTQVSVHHRGLADDEAAAAARGFWGEALARLARMIDAGGAVTGTLASSDA